ncbi:MAG: hypothetical protein GTN65_17750 [Armatimonadetes bacterium]|nr:hypothetical protein [Armatimonadota bacterium]NIO98885.1 hypothetical protein [Armatimonadota bacterium]
MKEMLQWEALGTAVTAEFVLSQPPPGSLARAFPADFEFWQELQLCNKPVVELEALRKMLEWLAGRYYGCLCEPERYRKLWNANLPAMARRRQKKLLRDYEQDHKESVAENSQKGAPRRKPEDSASRIQSLSRPRQGPRRELLAPPTWLADSARLASISAEEEFFAREAEAQRPLVEKQKLTKAMACLTRSQQEAVTEYWVALREGDWMLSGKMGDSLRQLWGDAYNRKRQALLRAKGRSKAVRELLEGYETRARETRRKSRILSKGLMGAWRRFATSFPEHKEGFEALVRRELHPVSERDMPPALLKQMQAAETKLHESYREGQVSGQQFADRVNRICAWMKKFAEEALASKQEWFAHAAKWWAEYYCRFCFTVVLSEYGIYRFLKQKDTERTRRLAA